MHQSESIFLSHDHIHVLQQVDCSVKLLAGCCETAGDSCSLLGQKDSEHIQSCVGSTEIPDVCT